jgi:serine/threonine protein kinase
MSGGTSVVSRGYTAPEQMNGQAVKQSDFYSLGRTFVFLLTGREPSEIHYDADDDVLHWRKYASNVEPKLAQLLDQMQSALVRQRPKNTQEILQSLQDQSTASKSNNSTSTSPVRGEDIEIQLEISAKEAEKGASKTVSVTRSVNINGKQQQEAKQITVTIPQGARDGQKLRLKEQGNAGKYGGDTGDAYVQVKIRHKKSWILLLGIPASVIVMWIQYISFNRTDYPSSTIDTFPSNPIDYPKNQCGTGPGFRVYVLYTEENFNKISQDFCLDVASFKRIKNTEDGKQILQVASFSTQQEAANFEQFLIPYFPGQTFTD